MHVERLLHPHLGAEIVGVDLTTPLSTSELDLLRKAVDTYHCVLIHQCILSPEQQVAFCSQFGALETYPEHESSITGYPEVLRIASRPEDGYINIGAYWHHDGSFRELVTDLSFFHLIAVPETSEGDTYFVNMHHVLDDLPRAVREAIATAKAQHTGDGNAHALVRRHPRTGLPALYFSTDLIANIAGKTKNDSVELLSELKQQIEQNRSILKFRWTAGDLMIVDNAALAHKATPITSAVRRVLQRTATQGHQAF